MPPKRPKTKAKEGMGAETVEKKAKVAPKKRGPWKMPPPLPKGELLTDFEKKQWVLGPSVGKGGFGEIYLATLQRPDASLANATYVIKIEPHENGPLFTELSFYRRIARVDQITRWTKEHGLKYLALPKYINSGAHEHGAVKYRFLVMERFGEDVESKFCNNGRKFSLKTVCHLALRLLEALEYLHESEYVHADIKGSNLLTGYGDKQQSKVYLVDFGLAYRFNPEGEHKDYKEDPRRSHDGTIEFTSIDAHKGVSPSRRGDVEILGYCLLQWASGQLPWEDNLTNKPYVAAQKLKYKSDVDGLMKACFKDSSVPGCLKNYMSRVYQLGYKEQPDYGRLKGLFYEELHSKGMKDDSTGLDWLTSRKRRSTEESEGVCSPKRRKASPAKRPRPVSSRKTKRVPAAKISSQPVSSSTKQPLKPASSPKSKRVSPTKRPSQSVSPPVKRPSRPVFPPAAHPTQLPKKGRRKPVEVYSSSEGELDSPVKPSPSKIFPNAVYPSQLGYCDGEEAVGSRGRGRQRPRRMKQIQKTRRKCQQPLESSEEVPNLRGSKRKTCSSGRQKNSPVIILSDTTP